PSYAAPVIHSSSGWASAYLLTSATISSTLEQARTCGPSASIPPKIGWACPSPKDGMRKPPSRSISSMLFVSVCDRADSRESTSSEPMAAMTPSRTRSESVGSLAGPSQTVPLWKCCVVKALVLLLHRMCMVSDSQGRTLFVSVTENTIHCGGDRGRSGSESEEPMLLNQDRLIDAALRLVDEEGDEALSMRALAGRVDRQVSSLY